jgi:hypothetical protein
MRSHCPKSSLTDPFCLSPLPSLYLGSYHLPPGPPDQLLTRWHTVPHSHLPTLVSAWRPGGTFPKCKSVQFQTGVCVGGGECHCIFILLTSNGIEPLLQQETGNQAQWCEQRLSLCPQKTSWIFLYRINGVCRTLGHH